MSHQSHVAMQSTSKKKTEKVESCRSKFGNVANAFIFPLRIENNLKTDLNDSSSVYVLLQLACDYCLSANLKDKKTDTSTTEEKTVIYEMSIDTPAITHGELIKLHPCSREGKVQNQ